MSDQFDVIIIGSGFGGAASGCRLAQSGKKVLILERGRRWAADAYPREIDDDWIWDVDKPEHHNGWLDLRLFGDMSVAQCAGVGGGSLIYANVFVEAEPGYFDNGWPKEISYEGLKPYYDVAGKMLNVQTIPDNQMPERFNVMRDAATALGYGDRHHKVPLAVTFNPDWRRDQDDPFNDNKSVEYINDQGVKQGTCVHCGNCDIGCQVKAKNTLDLNYLAEFEKPENGGVIRPSHIVSHIEAKADGYTIHYDKLDNNRKTPGTISAKQVIVAAGSIGSTEILLRSRDQHKTLPKLSQKLGYGWCANGDFLTFATHENRDINPSQGPTITSAIDLLDGTYKGQNLYIEDGGMPDLLGNYMEEKLKSPWFKYVTIHYMPFLKGLEKQVRQRNPLKSTMLWFGQAQDVSNGQMYWGRPWYAPWQQKLKMDWDYRPSEPVYDAMASIHTELAKATNGEPTVPFTWKLFNNIVTPHPLGGCNMGNSIEDGVVDHKCEVFAYPGLYVMDGAVIPKAIGKNPSRTITALAERAAEIMIG